MTAHAVERSVNMAGRKRPCHRSFTSSSSGTSSESSTSSDSKKSKRQIAVTTFEKWQRNFDREHQTLTWLRCDKDKSNRGQVKNFFENIKNVIMILEY